MNWNFKSFKDALMHNYFELNPYLASFLGLEEYYPVPEELSESRVNQNRLLIERSINELQKHKYSLKNINDQYDADLIEWKLNKDFFEIVIEREYESNPFFYFHYLDYSIFLKLSNKTPDFIAECILNRLSTYNDVLKYMENNLTMASSPALEVFQASLSGFANSVSSDLALLAERVSDENIKNRLQNSVKPSLSIISDMVRLVKDLRINNNNPYSIGAERLKKLVYFYELKDEDLKLLLERGEKEVNALKKRLREIKPEMPLNDTYRYFLGEYPEEEDVLRCIEEILGKISGFIREKDIVDLYDLETLKVEKMPPYFEWASAMMSTPGPFIKDKLDSHFYVTLPNKSWDKNKKEEFLRNFNPYLLENLAIHEALPGHFLHSVYGRRIDNDVSKISYGYGFSEGWAHYCEEMMLEEGFRKGDTGGEVAKIREQMVRLVRLISSIRIHTGTMSLEESKSMFSELCYLDEESALQEALRATFDPGYMLYTYGKWMILELREKTGGKKDLKDFHNRLLSLGCPPLGLMNKYFGQIRYF